MDTVQIAGACHKANRLYCESIGDFTQPLWAYAPIWQRESAIAGVENCLNADNWSPEQSHESWLAQKEADGWIYGEAKDPERKEHPCMVPYDQLPAEQKVKDIIFVTIARTLFAVE